MARHLVYASLLAASAFHCKAYSACVTTTGFGDPYNPASGESVSCSSAAPNPDPQRIDAVAGSSNVSVSVAQGAALSVAGADAVRLRNTSTLTNAGQMSAAAGFAGVSLAGNGNTLTNTGTITGGTGVLGAGSGNAVVNRGAITGTAGAGVSLTGGDSSLVNSGSIAGSGAIAVQFGAGADSFTMEGGTIQGAVSQGDGRNRAAISGGTITGAVTQGNMSDDFRMTGGQIGSLAQGDTRDTFFMSGGTIVGAFEDGDVATMTGGTIGRVDMKLDNNIFDMSGGAIRGNLVAGFGNDTIRLSDGVIGGNISVSGGTDSLTITGGRLEGSALMSFGSDTLSWDGGGTVLGRIDMGPDSDTATLRNLGATQLAPTASFDGGLGTDTLTLDNTQAGGVARFANWESVALQRGSGLAMDGDLVLGDSGTGTGALTLDATSTLKAVPGTAAAIRAMTAGQLASVTNAGTIDLTGGGAANRLTIAGNYTGNGGTLKVDAVLAGDVAAADRLIVSQGRIGGQSLLSVNNLGGAGSATVTDGIMVVQATNGATSDAAAFSMPQTVKAGPYQYFLYKGGVSAGSQENWYLRSTIPVVAPPAVPGEPQQPVPEQARGAPVVLPPAIVLAQPQATPAEVPIYRPEVAVQGAVVATSRQLAMTTLDTFHQRQGEQSLLTGKGRWTGSWGRIFGESVDNRYSGGAAPQFDGHIAGFQLGQDLYTWQRDNKHQDRIGLLASYARAKGDVRGFTLAQSGALSGSLDIDGYSLGAYWTHVGPTNWYTDAVAMVTWLSADMKSRDGMDRSTRGTATTLSLEGGYPLPLGSRLTLEPQAQLIAQFVSMNGFNDGVAQVSFNESNAYVGRLGLRLKSTFESGGRLVEPYLRANLWREFSGTDQTVYDGAAAVPTRFGSTSLQFGLGVAARVQERVSLYAEVDYLTDVSGDYRQAWTGNLGMRIRW
ncbi:outer membrane autotransporter protein [Cupriavidus alkaliphilus]|uniref:autotransporter family protein n=1 Tax=Cupriavidus alkaliphilus TaxID=942866 RepID=UPI000DE664DA|nr:autotransporter outer membrane beta-barrel domain-containing protein [Cupriavidus alkaliphilus]PVY77889.1 outer membrane autotransporter protein [Cupriavidus alkaliphilus]